MGRSPSQVWARQLKICLKIAHTSLGLLCRARELQRLSPAYEDLARQLEEKLYNDCSTQVRMHGYETIRCACQI